jgi:hypothetical protein
MQILQQLINQLRGCNSEQTQATFLEAFRKRTIAEITRITNRDLIIYVSDFKKNFPEFGITNSITWEDKTCFADLVEGFSSRAVDVLVHSPGGSAEATEFLVSLLRENFDDVRFIVPNMAKSAATMMVLSGNEILMDDRSELGPIDPQIQINGVFVPAQTVIDGFEEAKEIIKSGGPEILPAYLPLLGKYDLHILQICENAKKLSEELVSSWLRNYMFKDEMEREAEHKAGEIAKKLADHGEYLSHGRPLKIKDIQALGIKVFDLRKSQELRDKIWSLYCIIELTLDRSSIVKLYENSKGVVLMKHLPVQVLQKEGRV